MTRVSDINSSETENNKYDLAVVGGGLHGVSIAAEAVSRGLSVILLQGNDLASGPTGSIRSVLRGGLRKLEQMQLTTVNQNLREIALLKSKAPHLLSLQRFEIIEKPELRSNARINRGLRLYHYLQQRQLKKAKQATAPALPENALYYFDFQLSNARLIISLALHAKNFGARVRPHQKVVAAQRNSENWTLTIESGNGERSNLQAKVLVNCCGWMASSFLRDILKVNTRCCAQVSHYAQLVVRKPQAFSGGKVFQQDDGKLLYAHSLDKELFILGPLFAAENTEKAKNASVEKAMQIWNRSTGTIISLENIHYSWWTTRAKPEDPLSNNGVFRELLLDLNNPGKAAPLLNVFGVNTVQHRVIAEQAMEILQALTKAKKNPAYYSLPLPGGEFTEGMDNFIARYKKTLTENFHACVDRLVSTYGSLSKALLDQFIANEQGKHFGHDLYEVEVRYLVKEEWATCAEDILWRRTHLGLVFNEAEAAALIAWMSEHLHQQSAEK